MRYPIRALRVTSDRTGSYTHGEVEILDTRGNAHLLAMIARRANRLVRLARDFSIRTLSTDDYAGGAVVLRRAPLHVFHIRSVELDLAAGRSPRIALVGPEGARLLLNQDGALNLKGLAQPGLPGVRASRSPGACRSFRRGGGMSTGRECELIEVPRRVVLPSGERFRAGRRMGLARARPVLRRSIPDAGRLR